MYVYICFTHLKQNMNLLEVEVHLAVEAALYKLVHNLNTGIDYDTE